MLFLFFSIILWIGDLNYRISELDVDNVKELINKKDFETLQNYDQVILVAVCLCYSNAPYSSFMFVSEVTKQLLVLLSSRGKSMRKLCLLALWRERSISSPPTNMTLALTSGIQGNFISRPGGEKAVWKFLSQEIIYNIIIFKERHCKSSSTLIIKLLKMW